MCVEVRKSPNYLVFREYVIVCGNSILEYSLKLVNHYIEEEKMETNNIYYNVVQRLTELGKPVSWLEQQAGLGNGVIAGWKESFPRVDNLQKVANVLGVKLEELTV